MDLDLARSRQSCHLHAMTRAAERKRCPECNRQNSIKRRSERVGDKIIVVKDCRWCGWHDERAL